MTVTATTDTREGRHAPGPWRLDADLGNEAVLAADGVLVADCSIFVNPAFGQRTTERNQANARLIAAAPDMLAALKEADLCFGDQSREDVQSYWDARAEDAEGEGGLRRDLVRAACRARIYAAIAKADGR